MQITYNRQLHQREIDFINNKSNIVSFKSKLQTTTNKIYSDDEAKSILAKAAVSLTDKSFNETYRQSLSSNDLYNIELATNFIKQSSFYSTTLDNTNAFNPDKKQYEDRYMYASKAYDNSDFYKDNLYIKTNHGILDYTKSTIYGLGGFAVGGIEGLADLGNIILHPVDAINGLDNAFYHPILTAKNANANIQEFMAENFVDSVLGDQSSINYRSYHALGENIGSLGAAGKVAIKVGNKLSNINLKPVDKSNFNGDGGVVGASGSEIAKKSLAKQEEIKNLFDKTNNSNDITIGNKIYSAEIITEGQKGAKIFNGISDNEVKQFFKETVGINELPEPRKIFDERTGNFKGEIYVIEKNGISYMLRNFSKSAEQTGAKWTIDIPLYQNQKGMQIYKELKFKWKISPKYVKI